MDHEPRCPDNLGSILQVLHNQISMHVYLPVFGNARVLSRLLPLHPTHLSALPSTLGMYVAPHPFSTASFPFDQAETSISFIITVR